MYGAATAVNGVPRTDSRNRNGERAVSAHHGAAYQLASTRIVVLNPNIAVEDIPRRQALLARALPSARQRFKPAVRNARS